MPAQRMERTLSPEAEGVRTGHAMCPYCGVGCLLDIATRDNKVIELRGNADSPVNYGLMCPKGALLAPVLNLSGRLLSPQKRANRDSWLVNIGWDTALSEIAKRFREIIDQHGPDAVALYGSGQLDTEAWYLGNKLFKGFIGSNHVDSNSRLCMTSAAAAYRTMLGSDAPPTCYDDLDKSDCYLIAGSNMADAHPVTFQRLKMHRRIDPSNTMIVLDPRRTNTAQAADIHVPLAPGSDIAFFNAIGRIILDRGAENREFIAKHTLCFEEYEAMLRSLDLNDLAAICDVPLELIERVADVIIRSKSFLSFYCMGLGQSTVGTAKCQALIDLHLMLGQIGKQGSGPFSLTGQPNAMGGRELGGLAQMLPGYRMIENTEHRREVETYWGVPEGSINPKPGLTAIEMFQAIEAGRIKAVWIVCNNPMVSLPNLEQVRRALAKAELVIVQDCFETETTRVADYVLPAAQWIEKSGTMTNSERRVTRNMQLVEPPGEAKPDWWIFSRVAQQMGYSGFDFDSIEPIWDEFRGLTQGRPCDQFGMTNERLQAGPLQWPCPTEDHPGTARRYTDKKFPTPDGLARFIACKHQAPKEVGTANSAYPLTLTTGRLASQWHTMSRTGKIAKLANQASTPYVEMHPEDAKRYDIAEGDKVVVESKRGKAHVQAKFNDRIKKGVLFMPFHWGSMYVPGSEANNLTNHEFDPISKEPELKACAVRLQKAMYA